MSEANTAVATAKTALEDKILTFTVDGQIYGVELAYATEIIGMQPITRVPHVPAFVKGVINLRGRVVPVINVRARFGKEEIPYDELTCIVIVDVGDLTVGLIVDAVAEVITFTRADVSDAPDYKAVNTGGYISYLVTTGGEIKLVLDVRRLIDEASAAAE